jgi:hypothetical protein
MKGTERATFSLGKVNLPDHWKPPPKVVRKGALELATIITFHIVWCQPQSGSWSETENRHVVGEFSSEE